METVEIAAIVNVINLYPIAVDTLRWALFDEVFTEEARLDFGDPAIFVGLGPIKTAFELIHAPFHATHHATRGHHVRIDGDRATCLSYVHGIFIRNVPKGGNMFESTGWYDDVLVRTEKGWRISERSCRSVWWGGNPVVLATAPGMTVDPVLDSLRIEADAGRIEHFRGLSRRTS